MPTVFEERGFRFFFYSNEGNPREPLHVHVQRAGARAKVWVRPEVRVATSSGFDSPELKIIESLVEERVDLIARHWHEHFDE